VFFGSTGIKKFQLNISAAWRVKYSGQEKLSVSTARKRYEIGLRLLYGSLIISNNPTPIELGMVTDVGSDLETALRHTSLSDVSQGSLVLEKPTDGRMFLLHTLSII